MLAIVTVSAFECEGTREGLGSSWARREASSSLDSRSTSPGRSWHVGHWNRILAREKLMEKNGRRGRKGMVGEPDQEPR